MKKNLTDYDFPNDLKNMSNGELELLAVAIREFLINSVAETGGHLASNLGIVEITLGLHKIFDSPRDKIIWDVGHQCYVHKLLTGRLRDFGTLRKTGGMSGFPKSSESCHDTYDTGHSSTSLSVAAGMAAARDIKGEDYSVIAVIGDGAMTGGMAFEALNNISASKSKVIVILNDNGMSISRNTGGLSNHLNKLRASSRYIGAKKSIKSTLHKIPLIGRSLASGLSGAKDKFKYALISGGVIFEEMGFTYLGPIDGHSVDSVIEALEGCRNVKGPVILHMITDKGKGYRNAELQPNKFHGIGAFDVETGKTEKAPGISYSSVMGNTVVKLADKNEKIVAVTAAMGDATGLSQFALKYPKRIFDVGIAEQHAVTFAAGLAKAGMQPLVAIYSSFLQRAYDQIVEDVCLQNLPVVFALDRAGIVGADGETHHGLFDIAYLSSIPNMTLLAPADGNELQTMLEYAFKLKTPAAIRYPRGTCRRINDRFVDFDGKNKRLFSGSDADIMAVGPMVSKAVDAREILKKRGYDVGVLKVNILKPLQFDRDETKAKIIFTLEDGVVSGGYGMHVRERVENDATVCNMGWPDSFIEHGSQEDLYRMYGLDEAGIAEKIIGYIENNA